MALSNLNVVDATSISNDEKRVIMTIVDDISWDTTTEEKKKHIKMVETKINNYLRYITSGQVLNNYPEAVGYGVSIVIQCQHPVTRAVEKIYSRIGDSFKKMDINFGYFVEPQADDNSNGKEDSNE